MGRDQTMTDAAIAFIGGFCLGVLAVVLILFAVVIADYYREERRKKE
jgi:hypothetical protein